MAVQVALVISGAHAACLQLQRRTLVSAALALPSRALADQQQSRGDHSDAAGLTPRCITVIPNRETYDASSTEASHKTASSCRRGGVGEGHVYAADVSLQSSTPLTSLTADFIVPPLPKRRPLFDSQILYFWPGLKSNTPEMGAPVLQPVLQYGVGGPRWSVQSWSVDASDPNKPVAVTVPAIDAQPGNRITSFIRLSDDGSTWTVSATNTASGEDSTLHVARSRTSYDHAVLVNEIVNMKGECERMPAYAVLERASLTFTNLAVNGKPVPEWRPRARCAGNPLCDCGNAASIRENDGAVTLSWRVRT